VADDLIVASTLAQNATPLHFGPNYKGLQESTAGFALRAKLVYFALKVF
jgi:hypothetical protein